MPPAKGANDCFEQHASSTMDPRLQGVHNYDHRLQDPTWYRRISSALSSSPSMYSGGPEAEDDDPAAKAVLVPFFPALGACLPFLPPLPEDPSANGGGDCQQQGCFQTQQQGNPQATQSKCTMRQSHSLRTNGEKGSPTSYVHKVWGGHYY